MGQAKTAKGMASRVSLGAFALLLLCLALTSQAQAGPPFHARAKALDVSGLNHACGAAVDSKGDLYASNEGKEIKVYDPSHALLTTISNTNKPCGLAVDSKGNLYVSETTTGNVVRYVPNKYPFEGTPTYGSPTTIDASAKAKGISVDRTDDRLYVAEGDRIAVYDSSGILQEINEVQSVSVNNATGGSFKLKFKGSETAAIKFDASAAEVKSALEALSTIGAGNVGVEKPVNSYNVTFTGALGSTDVETLGTSSSLTPGTATVTASETTKGFSGYLFEGSLTNATGVAAYTYIFTGITPTNLFRHYYLTVADAATDQVKVFSAREGAQLKLRRTIKGVDHDANPETAQQSFGFGTAGAYLAADPGNESRETRACAQVQVEGKDQACTQGHFFLYDAANNAVDEFDATGEFVDQIVNAAFADAEPTALAVERSGAAGDGTLYVGAGSGAGAKLLAFRPLGMPARAALPALSHVLTAARSVAVDCNGYVYVGAEASIRVYDPAGNEVTSIEDPETSLDLAADCEGNVYTVDKGEAERSLTYYAPDKYPPTGTTEYTRTEPPLIPGEFESSGLEAVAVNPANGHAFVTGTSSFAPIIVEYGSAAEGSPVVGQCGEGLGLVGTRLDIDVYGATGELYVTGGSQNLGTIRCGAEPKRLVQQVKGGGCPNGEIGANPRVAIDQSNGHMIVYANNQTGGAREYDSSGACVAEFGKFSTNSAPRVAVDSSCAVHDPPLTESTTPKCSSLYPSNGNVYVASDGGDNTVQPNDVSAFGPLVYPAAAKYKLTVKKTGTGTGKVTSSPVGIDCGSDCDEEYEETRVVTLTATPVGLNSEFGGWSGCEAEPTSTECKVTMSEAREVTAEFKSTATEKVELKVKKTGADEGTVTSSPEGIDCGPECEAEFGKDDVVLLSAEADEGSEFVKWTGACSGTVPICEVTMSEAKEAIAEFDVEHPLLSVKKKGNGKGTVTSSPAGIDCGTTCSAKFDLDEEVTLEAEAAAGSVFEGWQGCDAEPTATECEVTMTGGPREVKATFLALPQALAKPALPIGYDEATLRGEVGTAGLVSEYHFEYLTQAEYEENGDTFTAAQSTPVAKLPAGEGFVAVSAAVTGLAGGTEYRFRLVAENAVGLAEDEGPAFNTLVRPTAQECANAEYRTGLGAFLPDCRAYELVTPANLVSTAGGLSRLGSFSSSGAGNRFFSSFFVNPRGPGAGESLTYKAIVPGVDASFLRAQRGEGEHPGGGWQNEPTGLSFAQAGGSQGVNGEPGGVSADQRYALYEIFAHETPTEAAFPIGTYLRVPAGEASRECAPEPKAQFEAADPEAKFELVGCGMLGNDLKAQGRFVSAGGTHVVFSSKVSLEGSSPPSGTEAIYDRAAGKAQAEVVSVKPDGTPFEGGEAPRYLASTEDGEAVVFSSGGLGGPLYVHREGTTTQVAAAPSTYAGISEDGKRVFFMDKGYFPKEEIKRPPPAGLFACDVEGGNCAGAEVEQGPIEIASESNFVNVSADGSHVFFTSEETEPSDVMELGKNENGEEAQAGEANLYAWDGAQSSFVAVLHPQDLVSFRTGESLEAEQQLEDLLAWTSTIPGQRANDGGSYEDGRAYSPTRSTPDGEVFAFQSHARLSAYDNEGKGEIYRYDLAAPVGSELVCVSCNPSGAPHESIADSLFQSLYQGVTDSATMVPNLSDDGKRVFFESRDPLVPEDANSVTDVYEWTALGTAGPGGDTCNRPQGCLGLISSGQGEADSLLFGLAADGEDAFFITQEKLVGQDALGSFSIYDARVLGGIPDPPLAAPCQGDACQGEGSTPPTLPTPASTGPGGSDEEAGKGPAKCAKGKHRVKGRCVGRKHRKRHHKHAKQRAGHNRGARR